MRYFNGIPTTQDFYSRRSLPTPYDLLLIDSNTGKFYCLVGGVVIESGGGEGPQGPQGEPGPQGIQGIPGQDGAQGVQGPPGNDGAQGEQGIQGIQGVPGADGADGAPGDVSTCWPVGSIFISVVATNPSSLLGFGTWVAFGAGRVLVGLDSGQTEFDTVKETGGAKTVTLTGAQSGLPQHTHTQDAHTHNLGHVRNATTGGVTTNIAKTADTSSTLGTGTLTDAATAVNQNAGPVDAAQAHNNLQPYIVVHMWERTA